VQFDAGVLSVETTGDGVADFQIQLTGLVSFNSAALILV
jgi:hypothetical protein